MTYSKLSIKVTTRLASVEGLMRAPIEIENDLEVFFLFRESVFELIEEYEVLINQLKSNKEPR